MRFFDIPMLALALALPPALVIAPSPASAASPLAGMWEAIDGESAARIAPCAKDAAKFCATVVRETLRPGEIATLGKVVLSDLVPAGKDRWRGTYHLGKDSYGATVRMRTPDKVEMKVCQWVFCQTGHYRRIIVSAGNRGA